mgnify:CR=1 FL=1
MNAVAFQNSMISRSELRENTSLEQSERRWTFGLFFAAVLGAIAGLGGLAIGGLSLVGAIDPNTRLVTVGTLLIVAAFPLFFLGAHCIDKADAVDKAIRREYCRQHGMQDEDC